MKITRDNYEAFFLDYMEDTLSEKERLKVELFLAENPDLAVELEEDLPSLTAPENSFDLSELKKKIHWDEDEVSELLIAQLEKKIDGELLGEVELNRLEQFKDTFPERFVQLEKIISFSVAAPDHIPSNEEFKLNLLQFPIGESSTELIAAVEGDLSREEQARLEKKLAIDKELARAFSLFQSTKSEAKTIGLPTEFKKNLKKKESVIIPLWAKSMAVAAAVLLAFFISIHNENVEISTAEFAPREEKGNIPSLTNEEELILERSFADLANERLLKDENSVEEGQSNSEDESIASVGTEEDNKPNISYEQKPTDNLIAMSRKETLIQSNTNDNALSPLIGDRLEVDPSSLHIFELNTEAMAMLEKRPGPLTPIEYVKKTIKDKVQEEEDDNLAVSIVNSAVKKLSDKEEDLIAFEKADDESGGFKFRLGKFSIETTR